MKHEITDQQVELVIEEIKATVYKTDMGMKFAAHPLYHTIWTHDDVPESLSGTFGMGWLRTLIRHKLEVIAEAESDDDYATAIWAVERPYRVQSLCEYILKESLDPNVYPKLILDIWMDTEFPHTSIWEWHQIFTRTEPAFLQTALTDGELMLRKMLSDQVTIYRGAGGYNHDCGPGFSWTLNKLRALWFARRFSEDEPRLFTMTINKSALVGPLTGRGEDEMILLNPSEYDIQELEINDEASN